MIIESLLPLAIPIDSVVLLDGNPRRGDIPAVKASLKAFGQRTPIVVRKATMEVVAGNHRLRAAQELGWTEIAAVIVDDDEIKAKAFALADNRTAELGGYDAGDLARMMSEVADADADLFAATAWTESELEELLGQTAAEDPTANTDPDDAPPIEPDPLVRPGDVFLLGPHRLVCGDARSPRDMDLALGGHKANLVWTDPPYGVAIVGRTKDKLTIANDEVNADKLEKLLDSSFANMVAHTKPGACWYVAAPSGPFFAVFGVLLTKLGVWRQTIAWVKDVMVLGRSDYHGKHESIFYGWTPPEEGLMPVPPPPVGIEDAPPAEYVSTEADHLDEGYDNIVYGWTPGAAHQAPPNRKQDTVWYCKRPKRNPDHPTMKPIDLIRRGIENSSRAGDWVLDGFGGSGSTMIACHHTGRRAALIEMDPVYAHVICRRYQEHAGVTPIREADGVAIDFTRGATPRNANAEK